MKYLLSILLLVAFLNASEDDYKELSHIPKDLSFLHLKKDQKDRLKKILKAHQDALKKVHKTEEQLEERLKDEFLKKDFNKEWFLEQNKKLKQAIAKIEAEFFAKIHKILNRAQRAKFIEYIEEWEVE